MTDQSGENPPRKRVLIVEDERVIALDLRGALEQLGYDVVGVASTSTRALDLAAEGRPDVVLMDIRIAGDTDGIGTAALLRARSGVPIVYLTANTDSETLERALATVPGGYLSKPYTELTLGATIAVALHQHEVEVGLRDASARLTEETSAVKPFSTR
jgi:CheY-like chemotaxis protein